VRAEAVRGCSGCAPRRARVSVDAVPATCLPRSPGCPLRTGPALPALVAAALNALWRVSVGGPRRVLRRVRTHMRAPPPHALQLGEAAVAAGVRAYAAVEAELRTRMPLSMRDIVAAHRWQTRSFCSACGAESARVPRARVPSASRMPRLPAPRPSRQGTSSSATSRTTSAPSRSARAAPVPAHTPLAAPPARRARGEHDHPRIPNRRLSALGPPSPALHAAARFYRHALLRTCAATSANVTQTNMRRLKLAPLQIFASSRLARPRRQRQRRHSTSCKTLPRPPPPSHLPSTSCRCAF